MNTRHFFRIAGGLWICTLLATGASIEDSLDRLEQGLEEIPGKVSLDSRLRYEVYDAEGGLDVDGISHRIRYGYTTPVREGFQGMIEGETIYAWGHGRDLHPADNAGDGTELNQLWLAWEEDARGSLKIGRQVYTLDDHRFIGHVGWRQNIQTFDALTGQLAATENLLLKAFFIDAVNTVTAAHNEIEAFGLNLACTLTDTTRLTAFYYALDGSPDISGSSSDTAGLRLTGKLPAGEMLWNYAFSYARQWENSAFPGRPFGHDYLSADISLEASGWVLGGGLEILSGNGRHGFSTPLATLHKFNGFADVFLAPSSNGGLVDGLEDVQIYLGYHLPVGKGILLRAIHHWFGPERGGGTYGTEIDFVASYTLNKHLSILGKVGRYDAERTSGPVGTRDKTLLSLELNLIY
ncbi:MAG: alginate export family protein [Oceanipulchritudo sp.]